MTHAARPEIPHVVVGVLILNPQGEMFIAKCPKWGDKWIIPGGHLDWGETLEACAAREAKEETNLDIDSIELVDIQESIFSEEYHDKRHMIFMDFSAKAKNSDVILNDELTEYKWVKPEDALRLGLNKSTGIFIRAFLDKAAGKNPKVLQ